MKYLAEIKIMPHKELLDPQGKAVNQSLESLGLEELNHVRIGKMIQLEVDAMDENSAKDLVNKACEKLLVNKIMEQYEFTLSQIGS